MLIVLGHTAIAISGRESSYGEGNRYEKTDWAEGLMSSIAYNLGIETYGIRQYSIGPTQIKYGTADSEIPDNVKEKIGLTGPGDLRDDLKALLATVAVLASNYNKAKLKCFRHGCYWLQYRIGKDQELWQRKKLYSLLRTLL